MAKAFGTPSARGSVRRAVLFALGAALALLPSPAISATRVMGTGGASLGFAGQRNLIFKPKVGYWVFFKALSARVVS